MPRVVTVSIALSSLAVMLGCGGTASLGDCAISCDPAQPACPEGASCRASGFCVSVGVADVCTADGGALGVDAPPVDAEAADARPCAPQPECPEGFIMGCPGSTRCYLMCYEPRPHAPAAELCRTFGGTLVSIEDSAENDCMRDATAPYSAWIGLGQGASAAAPTAGWSWPTGPLESQGFAAFAIDEPDDADGIEDHVEDCGLIDPSGEWRDEACGGENYFICEW